MQKYPHVNAAHKYARDVVAGKIPACLYARQACQRQIDDLENEKKASFPYRFDRAKAEKICKFAELMPHVKGKWAGSLIRLQPWQCFCLAVPFGWVRKTDGMRRFREIYDEIPRKNGKSILGAIIGNYMLTADGEEGSEVYSGATSEKQALEVFRPAWQMVQKNTGFAKHFNLDTGGTYKNPKAIFCLSTASRFEPVVGNPGDGASPHCALVDEYHEHKSPELYDTMKTGMGARTQSMIAVITTAGTNLAGPCYDKRQQVVKILSGELVNDQIFCIIYSIDPEDDWTDFENWKKANPNFGVSVFEDYLRSQLLDAKQSASKQNIIQCKHLNRWCNAGVAWMNMVAWEKCKDTSLRIEDFAGEDCWPGIDLASKIDIAAMIPIFKRSEIYYLFCKFYIPEDRTKGEDKTHYAGWVHDGYITATPGSRIDFDTIEDDLRDLARNVNIMEVGHDPWNAAQFVTHMQAEGLEMVEVPQTINFISEPMKELESLVLAGKLRHDGNPVMTWMMSNVVARRDKKDNVFPYKEHDENKIDGPVAAITGLSRAMVGGQGESDYAEQAFVDLENL